AVRAHGVPLGGRSPQFGPDSPYRRKLGRCVPGGGEDGVRTRRRSACLRACRLAAAQYDLDLQDRREDQTASVPELTVRSAAREALWHAGPPLVRSLRARTQAKVARRDSVLTSDCDA